MKLPQPNITPIGHRKYLLEEDFQFTMDIKNYKIYVNIKKGFIYDGTSAPQILWTITGITPDGIHRAASLVHDYLYRHKGDVPRNSIIFQKGPLMWSHLKITYSRYLADYLYYQLLGMYNKRKISNLCVYLFVRAFGWIKWK